MRVLNDDVRNTRIILIVFCIILPIAPFLMLYLFFTRNPANIVEGSVTNKRMQITANIAAIYFITIETKELNVSNKIYEMLLVGDYISAAYRKNVLYYYTK